VPSRLAVIRNPHSGTAADAAAIEKALGAAGSRPKSSIRRTGTTPRPPLIASPLSDVLVAAGGDGTVCRCGRGRQGRKTLAIIPPAR
jgi:diacylglycerol kinase family enzyme